MPEYIEREALIEKIINTPTVPIRQCYQGNFVYADGTASRQNEIIDYINKQLAADVVEVVRCGQCQHWKINPRNLYGGYCRYCESASIDHFCSYGERKGD